MRAIAPGVTALVAGAAAWAIFVTVALLSAGPVALTIDEAGIYSADAAFAAQVATRNLLVFAGMVALAHIIATRAGNCRIRVATALIALGIVLGAWVLTQGHAAGALGLAADPGALMAATITHTIPELAVMALPLSVVATGGRIGRRLIGLGAAGVVVCTLLEAFA